MKTPSRKPLAGLGATSFGTLLSRVLGLVRDMATAALLGVSADGAMDAFVLAFRVPNLFRRLFGEGALASSYLPVLTRELETDPKRAWQVASVTLSWLTIVLAGVVLAGEIGCAVAWCFCDDARTSLLIGLAAVMLPYLLFVCLAAQLSGTLNALHHFAVPALVPAALNVCWLAAAWFVAPWLSADHRAQAYVLAGAVLVAGVLQVVLQLPVLRRVGFRFDYNWRAGRDGFWTIVTTTGAMALGLAVTQVNTLLDSLMAWCLTAPAAGDHAIAWLGGWLDYPFGPGATAAIYFGERIYQFPLGMLGIAVATAIFPTLTRHAARGDHDRLGDDLTLGLRLVLFLGLPASLGLVILAHPLATLFFQHGDVTAADASRVARVIACYSVGVWAFCAAPVLARGYYARGDQRTPVRSAFVSMVVNLVFNVALVWPLGEAGMALSTSLAAVAQLAVLAAGFDRGLGRLGWPQLRRTAARSLAASLAMGLVAGSALLWLPATGGMIAEVLRVGVPCVLGVAVVLLFARLLGMDELGLLRPKRSGAAGNPRGLSFDRAPEPGA